MRVGFFTEVYHPVINGIVASIDGLAAGLRRLGHEVYVFTPHMPGSEDEEEDVYRIPSLPLPTATEYRLTLPLVSRARRKAVLSRVDVLHAHSPFVTGWMSVRYARRLGIPLVYTYHTQLEEYAHYVPFEPAATRLAASTLTRGFANMADAVIVPSGAMRERLLELGVYRRVEVVPSGIDLHRFGAGRRREDLRRRLGVRAGERLLLCVSRLGREKNIELLLDAIAHVKAPVRLVIAGEGPDRQVLQSRARELGVVRRTHFLGAVPRKELPDLYASADAFVFASLTETQGLVIVEALAAGAFVIAAEAAAIPSVLRDAGRIVAPDARAFAEAIDAVPARPDPLQGERSRTAAAGYGVETQAKRIAGIYGELTSNVCSIYN